MKITKKEIIEVKRLYLPVEMAFKCPNCGKDAHHDFSQDYLSHPVLNSPEQITIYCEHCDHIFERNIYLRMSIDTEE